MDAEIGCGSITEGHTRNLSSLRRHIVCGYASRNAARAEANRRRHHGQAAYSGYTGAIEDRRVDAVLIAVRPRFHVGLALQALAAGKHVIVQKPAFPRMEDYRAVPTRAVSLRLRRDTMLPVGSMLYQVSALDPVISTAAPLVLAATALLACYLPARPRRRWCR